MAAESATASPGRLRSLLRSTAFKLTAAYLVIFAVFALFVLGYVAWNARRLLDDQIRSTIDAEITGLAEQHRLGGIRRLVGVIERRVREPGASLYLVTTPRGERLAGNIEALPPGALDRPGESEVTYARASEGNGPPPRAIVRVFVLEAGFRLMVGRDVEERERLKAVIRRAGGWSLGLVLVLGCFGAWFVTARVLKRLDGMNATAQSIMAGDLKGRIAVAGTSDELDQLALNLNAMLDRIGELMTGMQQVSDNIAHDLKTPLTRLRNRAEEALRLAEKPEDLRAALDGNIEEADNLIRVFNALLMIARIEAGQIADSMETVDASALVADIGELYEALAEDAGLTLAQQIEPGVTLRGNRELIGQALANLLDNAIKYGKAEARAKPGEAAVAGIALSLRRSGGEVLLEVADRGPGIPEVDRSRVLERFVRLDQSRSKPGFGLGLSLAAGVARMHGGAIRLEDNNPGLRVTMTLPHMISPIGTTDDPIARASARSAARPSA
jgi:signal transduction histidine kinase